MGRADCLLKKRISKGIREPALFEPAFFKANCAFPWASVSFCGKQRLKMSPTTLAVSCVVSPPLFFPHSALQKFLSLSVLLAQHCGLLCWKLICAPQLILKTRQNNNQRLFLLTLQAAEVTQAETLAGHLRKLGFAPRCRVRDVFLGQPQCTSTPTWHRVARSDWPDLARPSGVLSDRGSYGGQAAGLTFLKSLFKNSSLFSHGAGCLYTFNEFLAVSWFKIFWFHCF